MTDFRVLKCAKCGVTFIAFDSRQKYCSRDCQQRAAQERSYLRHREKRIQQMRDYYQRRKALSTDSAPSIDKEQSHAVDRPTFPNGPEGADGG